MIFNFPALIVQSIWQLTFKSSWFFKKKEKKPKQKTQTAIISISDKQNNCEWGGKDLTCKSCGQSCLCLQQLDGFFHGSGRSLGSGEHQLDVWHAGHCPANSCSTKMALLEQISAAVSALLGTFHIPATEIRGWQQVLYKQFTVSGAYGY